MFWKKNNTAENIPWIQLENESQLEEIYELSNSKPVLIFKHSTRCSISSMTLNRFESDFEPKEVTFYFLDLIAYRNLSNKIAEDLNIKHESPQVLLVKEGKCVYSSTHNAISFKSLVQEL